MTKTLNESRYSPKYKFKSKIIILKDNNSTKLLPNLLNLKLKLLSGKGFVEYKKFLYLRNEC